MTTTTTVDGDEPPLKRRLRRMIDLRGLAPVADELGIGRQSLACYLAGIHVQAGTFALIEARLSKLVADDNADRVLEAKCAESDALLARPDGRGGGRALPR